MEQETSKFLKFCIIARYCDATMFNKKNNSKIFIIILFDKEMIVAGVEPA